MPPMLAVPGDHITLTVRCDASVKLARGAHSMLPPAPVVPPLPPGPPAPAAPSGRTSELLDEHAPSASASPSTTAILEARQLASALASNILIVPVRTLGRIVGTTFAGQQTSTGSRRLWSKSNGICFGTVGPRLDSAFMLRRKSGQMGATDPAVFICYRREDSGPVVGRFYDRLSDRLGRARVFKDTDSVPLGTSFRQYIGSIIGRCRLVLVFVGPNWLARGREQWPRLFDDGDHVCAEIKAALEAGVAILPVFSGGAKMPDGSDIPEEIRPLVDINGSPLREDPDFDRDYEKIYTWIRNHLSGPGKATRVRETKPRPMALRLLLVLGLMGGAATLVVWRRHQSVARPALVAAPGPPAPAGPELASRYHKVENFLEFDEAASARKVLEQLLSERPKDARAHYLLGRVAYAEDKHDEALVHYREAIELDPGFRGDPVLLAHVERSLAEPVRADGALDLVIDRIGAPAADLLENVANNGTDLARRKRAATALDEIGQGKRIDQVSLALLELKKASSCQDKLPVVGRLRQLGDPRALPALRGLRGRSVGPLRLGAGDTACMKTELTDTITELEQKSGRLAQSSRRAR